MKGGERELSGLRPCGPCAGWNGPVHRYNFFTHTPQLLISISTSGTMQALRSSIARSCPSAAVGGAISRPASAPLRLLSTAPALRFAQAVGTGPAGSNSGTAKQDAQLAEDLAHAKQEMIKLGFNEESFWVQTICWGDHDQVSVVRCSACVVRCGSLRLHGLIHPSSA